MTHGIRGPHPSTVLALLWCWYKASLPLGHLQTSPAPTIQWGRGEKTNCLQRNPSYRYTACPESSLPLTSSCPQRCWVDVSYRDWLPCECLMLAQGLWALIMYSGNSWWASVIVWCAFSVIKRNDFPKSRTVFMIPVNSYPAVASESHSVQKSEKMTPQKKNQGEWRS